MGLGGVLGGNLRVFGQVALVELPKGARRTLCGKAKSEIEVGKHLAWTKPGAAKRTFGPFVGKGSLF